MHQYSISIGRDVPKSDKWYSESNELYYGNPKGNKYDINEIYTPKIIFQCFLSQLYCWVIVLDLNCGIREPLLICRTLKSLMNARLLFTFTFEICDHT